VPIGFTFFYHLHTGPQIKRGGDDVVEERRCEINDPSLNRKTCQLASPDSYVDDDAQRTTAMGGRTTEFQPDQLPTEKKYSLKDLRYTNLPNEQMLMDEE
jgi:hypothetical protein